MVPDHQHLPNTSQVARHRWSDQLLKIFCICIPIRVGVEPPRLCVPKLLNNGKLERPTSPHLLSLPLRRCGLSASPYHGNNTTTTNNNSLMVFELLRPHADQVERQLYRTVSRSSARVFFAERTGSLAEALEARRTQMICKEVATPRSPHVVG